ncbi:MAG: P1 family peptidase [Firmicutes bacterium]|nr:P1 family peptidase [Bacillota bacterium]
MNKEAKFQLPEGIKIGHAQNDKTGVTVILSEDGAVGGVSVRGCAPGTRETDLLKNEKSIEKINAVVLSGGSAYGLSSCDGVMEFLQKNSHGFAINGLVVPIVCGAVIFDLNHGEYNFSDKKMGLNAAKNAKEKNVKRGQVGAGTCATIGKITGLQGASKGGIGLGCVKVGNAFVSVISVVNAFGDVVCPKTGVVIAGARLPDGSFLNTNNFVLKGNIPALMRGANTTLSCIMTNVALTKLQANKLADIAHNGFVKTISPVHTDFDGDTIFVMSQGDEQIDFLTLSSMAVESVSRSILNSVE